jgi:hypothetical protein
MNGHGPFCGCDPDPKRGGSETDNSQAGTTATAAAASRWPETNDG